MAVSVWILGDQLLEAHPALEAARASGDSVRVVLVENWRRWARLPYHRQKIVLLLSAMRHYAQRLKSQGLTVDYVRSGDVRGALAAHLSAHSSTHLYMMRASEYRGGVFQDRLAESLGVPVTILPNTQFLVGQYDPFPGTNKRVILENFYRAMRRHFDVLMQPDGEPVGGQWNFDHDNRKPLPKKGLNLPNPPRFEPDDITRDIIREVNESGLGVGSLDGFGYAVTHEDAAAALDDFIRHRLPLFGDYEDAMTTRHRTLFHSVLSPYINLGLLTPLQMVDPAVAAYEAGLAPLNSVEGFVRQVIGWREYMFWQYQRQMPALAESNDWNASRDVPEWMWTGKTDMNCLRHVLESLLATGYTHHIERLMVLSNFFMLAGVNPQAATRWFSALYVDAYDWVMQTNVVGMGLNADGGIIATKPYIASANYINKMGDACGGCRFNPKQRTGADACPFNTLYWNFLITHEARLRANPRSGPAVLGLKHLSADERVQFQAEAAAFLEEYVP
jgi:deoxyribodipyrimidine photolyase-related protein